MSFYDTRKLKKAGDDVLIDEHVIIRFPEAMSVGDHVAIDGFTDLAAAVEVGSYVHIATLVSVTGGRRAKVRVQDFCGIAAGCRLICATDDFLFGSGLTNPTVPAPYHGQVTEAGITLFEHSLLGVNCVLFPGVSVGEGAVASACSVIKKDLEPWTIYAGNPAVAVAKRRKDRILELEKKLRMLHREIRQAKRREN